MVGRSTSLQQEAQFFFFFQKYLQGLLDLLRDGQIGLDQLSLIAVGGGGRGEAGFLREKSLHWGSLPPAAWPGLRPAVALWTSLCVSGLQFPCLCDEGVGAGA